MNSIWPLYLDYASTTPLDPRVLEAMIPFFSDHFANASSKDHVQGEFSNLAIKKARQKVASLINAEANEIIFTSGSTEAINIGLIGAYLANKHRGNHIITVGTEHKAVLETCFYLERIGARTTVMDVNREGQIDLEEFRQLITTETVIVSVMHVNNETGLIQEINAIGEICKENNILYFCDATQSIGKQIVDVGESKIDLLCLSGHKFNGPKGIGALYVKSGVKIEPIFFGGGQENMIRPGTYNTPLIVGLGTICEIAQNNINENYKKIEKIQIDFESLLVHSNIGNPLVVTSKRSPYISSILLTKGDAKTFILLNQKIFSVSTGSACNSLVEEPSHVIMAMLKDKSVADKVIRLSYGISLEKVCFKSIELSISKIKTSF